MPKNNHPTNLYFLLFLLVLLAATTTMIDAVGGDYLYFDAEENAPVMEFVEASSEDDEPGRGDFRASDKPKMVEFYNPYCGACQAYKPTYLKLARDLEEEMDDDMEFYAVSCAMHKELCNTYGIDHIPFVGLFPLGQPTPSNLRPLAVKEKHPAFIIPFLFPERDVHELHHHKKSNANQQQQQQPPHVIDIHGVPQISVSDINTNTETQARVLEEEEKEDDIAEKEEEEEEEEDVDEGQAKNDEGEEEDNIVEPDNHKDTVQDMEEEDKDVEEESGDNTNREQNMDEKNEENPAEDDDEEKEDKGDNNNVERPALGRPRPKLDRDHENNGSGDEENGDEEENEEPDGSVSKDEEGNDERDEDPEWVQDANRDWMESFQKPVPLGGADNLQRPRPVAGAGAILKADTASDMDRYKEAMLQKHTPGWINVFRKDPFAKLKEIPRVVGIDSNTGATDAMKAHTPGTPEYEERQKQMQAHVDKLMKKKRLRTVSPGTGESIIRSAGAGGVSRVDLPANHKPVLPFKKEVQPKKMAHKVVEKIPLAKRFVVLTREEELILDSSLSFLMVLRTGLFTSPEPLTKGQIRSLQSWLDLLRISLPPEWGIHELIMDMDNNIDIISQSYDNLVKFLERHELPRKEWSHSCTNDVQQRGFNCGFWKLLHIVSVGVAEHRGGLNLVESGLVSKQVRTFSPFEAADVMKEFIKNFFPCTPCRNHFVAQYDECSNRRCVRLTDEIEGATNADWLELSKWLWEVHNDVNVRLFKERSAEASKEVSLHDEITVLYPSLHECLSCFKPDGSYDEDGVFLFLEREYWPGSSEIDPRNDYLFKFHDVEEEEFAYLWAFVVLSVWVMYFCRPRCCGVFSHRRKKRAD